MTQTSAVLSASTEKEEPRRGIVVVAVDGSSDSDRAVRFAVGEAQRRGHGLRLVHVESQTSTWAPMPPAWPTITFHEVAAAVVRTAAEEARLFGWSGSEIDLVITHGPRREAILEHTADASCLVVGRRSSMVNHLLTGSTTSSLAAHADVPVISVPRSWDPDVQYGLVVTGVDVCTCDQGREVVSTAFAEAAARGSRLDVTHAWRPDGVYDVAIGARVLETAWADTVRHELFDMVHGTRVTETVPWSASARYERPALALHEAGEHADLLVVGRHGHDSRVHRFVGSTARAVLRSSRCPVMVVPTVPHDTTVGRLATG
jgi:nucleotide-binding universal stress UspA family protein